MREGLRISSRALDIDEGFLNRVYRTSLLVGLFLTCGIFAYGVWAAVSFAIGGGISLSSLKILESMVRKYLVPGAKKVKLSLLIIALIKFPLLGLAFYFLVRANWLNLIALVAGLGLAQAVIILKALGIILVNSLQEGSRVEG